MTKKNLTFIALSLCFVSIIVGLLWITRSTNENNQPSTNQTAIEETKIHELTKNKPINSAYGNIEFLKNKDYVINYFPDGEYYQIGVLNSPFEKVRKEAEEEFLRELSISNTQACSLNVEITTPFSINPEEAGAPYPLSFCTK